LHTHQSAIFGLECAVKSEQIVGFVVSRSILGGCTCSNALHTSLCINIGNL